MQANPRRDILLAITDVNDRSEQQDSHPAFFVVMSRLQERSAFAGVHRRVVKVELGHGTNFDRNLSELIG